MTLLDLCRLLKKHIVLCIILPLLCAGVTAAYAFFVMPNTYTTTVSMYVLANGSSNTVKSTSVSSSDLSLSQMITNDVSALLSSSRVRNDVASALNIPDLSAYNIKVTSSGTTRVITVQVSGTDQLGVAEVANQLVVSTNDVAQEAMGVQSVSTIDQAKIPTEPSGPSHLKLIAVALAGGLFAAICIVVLIDMTNNKVRNVEEIEELIDIPLIGSISKF